jgi:hypothetical protein
MAISMIPETTPCRKTAKGPETAMEHGSVARGA